MNELVRSVENSIFDLKEKLNDVIGLEASLSKITPEHEDYNDVELEREQAERDSIDALNDLEVFFGSVEDLYSSFKRVKIDYGFEEEEIKPATKKNNKR